MRIINKGRLKILIACERYGVGRRAFAALPNGHDVWSIDREQADDSSPNHIVGDVLDGILDRDWDLVLGHPTCTRLTRTGRQWLSGPGYWTPPRNLPVGRTWQDMKDEFYENVNLFTIMWNANAKYVALENPVMHDLARNVLHFLPRPQLTQPYWFGEKAIKTTGWYLKNLPPLEPTNILIPPFRNSPAYKQWAVGYYMGQSNRRAARRSRSFEGMMRAAAEQWTNHILATEAPGL